MTGNGLSRAIKWPLWSWRNLAITGIAALALLALLGRLTDGFGPVSAAPVQVSTSSATALPATSATVPAPPATSTTEATPSTTATAAAEPPDADAVGRGSPVQVATAFVTAWASTAAGDQAWLAGMKPFATSKLTASMTGTDPAQVPATTVTGDARLTLMKGRAAAVSVPTDGGRIAVGLVQQAGTWKADTLAPDDAPPGASTPSLAPSTTGTGG